MSAALTNLLAFIVAISVLVAVHEFGHYLVGRLCGMKVLRFSIGFGKPIWTWRGGRDRTEYCISAIPLGGYVKFLDEREGPVEAADRGRAFNQRPVPARIVVLLAGPFFNFLFAVVAYWALFVQGIPTLRPAIGPVVPGSYAAEAGLQQGDRLLKVGDQEAVDWQTALVAIFDEMVGDGRVPLELEGADGQVRSTVLDVGGDAVRLTEPNRLFEGLGFQPWAPPALIDAVDEAGAAHAAGILPGDRITRIAGEKVSTFADLQRIVALHPAETVSVQFERDAAVRTVEVQLGVSEVDGRRVGLMGVRVDAGAERWYVRQHGPLAALGESIQSTWNSTGFTIRMLARMVTGDVSVKNISGPLEIAQFAGDSAGAGVNPFVQFLALVSISLGVLNLLPIPVLDGGQIVYQTVELLKGSPLSERSQLVGQQVGILALLLLMSFAFYNDIARILS